MKVLRRVPDEICGANSGGVVMLLNKWLGRGVGARFHFLIDY